MKKIFNVIGICALMCYLFIFPSCKESYDEEELLRDIEKKRHEIDVKEKTFVYAGDTFRLPAKITQIDSSNSSCAPEEINLTYSFNASDKEAIMHSLFELTSNLSDFGNFELDRGEKFFIYGDTPLKDAKIDVSDDATRWYYVGSNGKIYYVFFYELLGESYFVITNGSFQIDEDYIMQWPILYF
jgi:hypothetical protein